MENKGQLSCIDSQPKKSDITKPVKTYKHVWVKPLKRIIIL